MVCSSRRNRKVCAAQQSLDEVAASASASVEQSCVSARHDMTYSLSPLAAGGETRQRTRQGCGIDNSRRLIDTEASSARNDEHVKM